MLAVQVQYWANVENKRHNVATEDLGNRTLQENIRHNTVTEEETKRHNLATEGEMFRHNLQTESLGWANLAETSRSNQVREAQGWEQISINRYDADTRRFVALSNYSLGLEANAISGMNAQTNRMNALTQQESVRNTYSLGLMNAKTNQRQAQIASRNADTNLLNAMTRNTEANIAQDKLKLEQQKWRVQQYTTIVDSAGNAVRNVSSAFSNIMNSMVPASGN